MNSNYTTNEFTNENKLFELFALRRFHDRDDLNEKKYYQNSTSEGEITGLTLEIMRVAFFKSFKLAASLSA